MKTISTALIYLLLTSFTGWLNNFEQAKKEATKKGHYILLNFSGSDWCVPCIKQTKEIFETTAFRTFADSNLVLVNADFPRSSKHKLNRQQQQHNEALAEKYNAAGKFPYTVLLTAGGQVLKSWNGMTDINTVTLIQQIKLVRDAGN